MGAGNSIGRVRSLHGRSSGFESRLAQSRTALVRPIAASSVRPIALWRARIIVLLQFTEIRDYVPQLLPSHLVAEVFRHDRGLLSLPLLNV